MLTTFLAAVSATLAAVAAWLLMRPNPENTPHEGIAGNANWQLKGSHNQVYLPHDLQAQVDTLKAQNAYLMKQSKRLTKQNKCLLQQLDFKNNMLENYHAQFLKQEKELDCRKNRVAVLEQRLENKKAQNIPLLPFPVSA